MKLQILTAIVMGALWAHADEPVRVIGPIADGTPAASASPLPTLETAPEDVLETRVHETADGTITLQKITPVELPPLPEVPAPAAQRGASGPMFDPAPASPLFILSATTYRSTAFAGQARTLFHWRSAEGENFTAWSNVDANWLGGFTAFEAAGIRYDFLLTLVNVDLDQATLVAINQGRTYTPPVIPALPSTTGSYVVTDGEPTPAQLAPLAALHQLIVSDGETLRLAHEGRELARLAKETATANEPPAPKNIVLRYWRVPQPAATSNEGGGQ